MKMLEDNDDNAGTRSMSASAFPKRTDDVERYLRQTGIPDVLLIRGRGYFTFEGEATEDWFHTTVEVPFLSDLTLDQWAQTFRAMDGNPANRKSIRATRRYV